MERKEDWRCTNEDCRTLLGVKRPGKLELAYKEVEYVFHGSGLVTTRCRNCGRLNDTMIT